MEKAPEDTAAWIDKLGPDAYHVMREQGTERPFSSEFCKKMPGGKFTCRGCGTELFRSDSQFESDCGWPSFDAAHQPGVVTEVIDRSHGMVRVEVRCASCDSHLGHLFPDGPTSTGNRYCINGICLNHQM